MICFRDITFCIADCRNKECTRKYTEQVVESANKWWGNSDAPIAISDLSANCPYFSPNTSEVDFQ